MNIAQLCEKSASESDEGDEEGVDGLDNAPQYDTFNFAPKNKSTFPT